jgi:hypothetical protein
MKAKGATSLYEVLKSASRPAGEAPGAAPAPAPASTSDAAPQPTLQERLAAYKAQKLAAVTSVAPSPAPEPAPPAFAEAPAAAAVAVAEATPPPAPAADPAPAPTVHQAPPAPALVEAGPSDGPGERVVRLTHNTLAFAGLVAVGLLFVAYAVGVQSGRRRAAAESVAEAPPARAAAASMPDAAPPPPPLPPPPPPKIHTIWLAEWKYGVASERLKAEDAVRRLKESMDKAGLRGAQTMKVKRGNETRLALHIDQVADTASPAARTRIEALRKFRFGTQAPFAQASYVEMPQ